MKILALFNIFVCASVWGVTTPLQEKAQPPKTINDAGFYLLDKVCVVIEGEEPVTLSEVRKRSEQRGEAFLVAQRELVRERLLWVYAKKQLKYDMTSIYKGTDEHISDVMSKNHLSRAQFEEVLMAPPYRMSYRQFRQETATEYLKSSVKQTISGQIATVTDEQLKNELAKKFDVVFITVHPKKLSMKKNNPVVVKVSTDEALKKANDLRASIQPTTKVNDIKKRFSSDADISIVGPVAYEKGGLKKAYDDRLQTESPDIVLGPFADEGSVTMLWKIKKSKKNLDETALEKLRKESYHNLVLEKFNALTDSLINSSTVIEKGCGKL